MGAEKSVAEIVATLESQLAFYRERESFHAQQEAFHREKRTSYAADLESVAQRLEAFRAAAGAVLELADRLVPAPVPMRQEDLGTASKPRLSRMVEIVLANLPPDARFGVTLITAELNRRFGEGLRRPVDERQISVVLRRMYRLGLLQLVRRGRPYWEALYTQVVGG
jgi:hypothetical protein